MSNRILDVTAIDRLSTLASIARENGLSISIDLIGNSPKAKINSETWIIQVFDEEERIVVTGRGRSAMEAVKVVHENWFNKHAPKV